MTTNREGKSTDAGEVLREIQETMLLNGFYGSQRRTAAGLEAVTKRLESLEDRLTDATNASSRLAQSLNFLTRVGVAVAVADFLFRAFMGR